ETAQPPLAEKKPAEAKKQLATVDLYGDPLPSHALARLGTVRFRTGTVTQSVALAPDGKTIATGSPDGLRLWDAETGQEIRRFDGGMRGVVSVAFSPDGTLVVTSS